MGCREGLALLCLMALTACRGGRTGGSLLPDTLRLREGDVVLRRCTGLMSRVVSRADRGGVFSHTGIVVDSAGWPMIVHAVPGEPDYAGDPDRVKMEPPRRFFARGRAVAAGVLRPREAEAGRRAARCAAALYRRGTRFDHDYDEADTTRMYCTELVVHAYRRAGVELVDTVREVVDLPSFHYRCILPSQILQAAFLEPIFMFNP